MHSSDLASHLHRFEATLAADREVRSQLESEVYGLKVDLQSLADTNDDFRRQLQDAQRSSERLLPRQQSMEAQLDEAKQCLGEARDHWRAANLEALSLRRDREHFTEELEFLGRTATEELESIDNICKVNAYLDTYNSELAAETEGLECQRRGLQQQVASEKELHKIQDRETAELRSSLERARRQHAAVLEKLRETRVKDQRIYELKNNTESWSVVGPPRPMQASNTWAAALTSPPCPHLPTAS